LRIISLRRPFVFHPLRLVSVTQRRLLLSLDPISCLAVRFAPKAEHGSVLFFLQRINHEDFCTKARFQTDGTTAA
jgi:hypothetical protein